MKESLISCIVPVYNGERYLGETLDSILAQPTNPWRLSSSMMDRPMEQRQWRLVTANEFTMCIRPIKGKQRRASWGSVLRNQNSLLSLMQTIFGIRRSSLAKSPGSTNDLKSTFVSLVATFGAHLRARKSTSLRDAII